MRIPALQLKIINQLAEKYNVPQSTVEAIVRSQFKFVKLIIEKGECESIRLKYLGIFGVTRWREGLKMKHTKKRMDREYEERQKEGPDEIL